MRTTDRLPHPAARLLSALPPSADPRMRRAFDRFHDRVNHLAMRWGMYTGALLWALAGVLGFTLRPWNADELAQSLGIVLPFYLAVGVALGNLRFRGHYQWLAALCNLSSGLLVFAMAPRLPEPGLTMLVGLVIITFHAVLGLRLRVQYALPVMLVYNGIYLARLWTGEQQPIESSIVCTFLIGMATLGAATAAVVLEANLWTLFRSRSVQRAKRMRPNHRMSGLPEDLGRRWHAHPGLVTERPETLNVLNAAVDFEHALPWELSERIAIQHDLFIRFDALAQRRGLERVRLSGGEFVAIGGAARIGTGSADDLAELALTMLYVAEEAALPEGITLSLRIGIDQGQASRTALGKVMPVFDVIGPGVDGAASLRDAAPAGCILVSERFQAAIEDKFETHESGTLRSTGARAFLLWGVRRTKAIAPASTPHTAQRLALPILLAMGAWSSTAAQWTRVEALPPFDTPSLHVSDGRLFVGTDSAVYITDDGLTWTRSATIPDPGYFIDALFADDDTLYAGTGGAGLLKSGDDGQTWITFSQGLIGLGSNYISAIGVRAGDLHCATVGAGVFRCGGTVWQPFDDLPASNAGNVDMLHVQGDTLWAGAGGNGFLWRSIPGSIEFEPIQVAPLQVEPQVITSMLHLGNELLIGGTYGLFRSSDGGNTWPPTGTGLHAGGTIRLLQTDGALYAIRSTANSRLYRSLDGGTTWALLEVMPFCYAIAAFDGILYAARQDGLWSHALFTGVQEPPATNTVELMVFPNPAIDRVHVNIPDTMAGMLELLDPMGQLVQRTTVQGGAQVLVVGSYAPGAYLLRLTHKDGFVSKRLIIY